MLNSIIVRPYEGRDAEAVLDIYRQAIPPGMRRPVLDLQEVQHYVAMDVQADQVIGFGAAPLRATSSLTILVMPLWQRRGVGHLLWESLTRDLLMFGTTSVELWVREENHQMLAWLQKREFRQIKHNGPVSIVPQTADMAAYDAFLAQVARRGIVLTTLANARRDEPDCLVRLHALYNAVNTDVPGSQNHPVQTLEDFVREQDEPDAIPDAYFIAKDGRHYVGLSYLRARPADPNCVEPANAQQLLTGVLPAYRRRGIAMALKVKAIAAARAHGFRRLLTNSSNPAMQALNAKLGFRSGPWLVYQKPLP